MKHLLPISILFLGLLICQDCFIYAQGVGINSSGSPADPSAILDASASNKGILIPRLTTSERDAISNPAFGLLIFNTTSACFNLWMGVAWKEICGECPYVLPALSTNAPVCPASILSLTASTSLTGLSYSWTGPSGFTSSLQNPSITSVTSANEGAYQLTVTKDGCVSKPVTINFALASPPGMPGPITSNPLIACYNSYNNVVFQVAPSAGADYYNWTVPSYANIISGQGTTIISVDYIYGNDLITVAATNTNNTCGYSNSSVFSISSQPPNYPDPITGPVSFSLPLQGAAYSVPSQPGTVLQWTVPPGASITSGQGTSSITVDYSISSTPGNLTVNAANGCGDGGTNSLFIQIVPDPVITGPDLVCPNATGQVYSITPAPNVVSYNWTVPAGATITSANPSTSSSITVTFGSLGGNITVTQTDNYNTSQVGSYPVSTTTGLGTFTPTSISINAPTMLTPTVSGAISYNWTFTGGSPATSTVQSPTVSWSVLGTYNVALSLNGCPPTTTVVTVTPPHNCYAILLANPSATSGVYTVTPSTGSMSCYCDMTTDGGGWTLVYRDSHDGIMNQSTGSTGTLSNLQSLSGPSAKYADNVISALLSPQAGTSIGYRSTSPNISQKYYHPWSCVYSTGTSNPDDCMKAVNTYTTSTSPSYTQFVNWGGGGGGINCWYNGNSYSNVICTSKNYTEKGSITTNSSFSNLGSSNSTYGNTLLLWVK